MVPILVSKHSILAYDTPEKPVPASETFANRQVDQPKHWNLGLVQQFLFTNMRKELTRTRYNTSVTRNIPVYRGVACPQFTHETWHTTHPFNGFFKVLSHILSSWINNCYCKSNHKDTISSHWVYTNNIVAVKSNMAFTYTCCVWRKHQMQCNKCKG